jgi:lysozyme family protein
VSAFDRALTHTVGVEGDFSDDPKDSGGATRFGVTERVARAYGYNGDMRALPFTTAKEIYRTQWWKLMKLDSVASLSEPIALEMFDTGVNRSQAFAVQSLQRSLNALNREQADYADIEADGVMGALTIFALGQYLAKRGKAGETVLLRALNCLQGASYIELTERRKKDETFLFGWLANRVA